MPGGADTTIPLRVPPLRETHDPAVERSERRVRAWVAELPVLNPVACLDALLDALEPLNREPLAPGARLALMEAYRPGVLAVLRGMDARTLRRLPLAPEARLEARARLVRLCEAQAAGYKHVVRAALAAGREPGAGDATLDTAWFRALEHTGWVLAAAWRARQDPPPFTWLELHQLHARLAAREVTLAAPAGDPVPPAPDAGALYRLWLLAAAADPFRLADEEQAALPGLLAPAAAACELRGEPCARGAAAQLALDPEADSPPLPAARLRPGASPGPLCLDAAAAEAHLRRLAAEGGGHAGLARRVLAQLRPGERRGGERRPVDRPVLLARGLGALHDLLGLGPERLADLVAGQRLGMSVLNLESEEERAVALDAWRAVNDSVRGLMAVPRETGADVPEAGEPVAIVAQEDEGGAWRVEAALARWVRAVAGAPGPAVGLERVPGRAAPVAVTGPGGSGEGVYAAPVRALSLPARLLCAPALAPEPGARLEVRIEGRAAAVRVAAVLERTPHVAVLALAPA